MYNGKCVTAVDEDGYDAPIHAVIGNGGPQEPSAKSSSEWSRYLGHDNGFVIIEAHNSSDLSITFFGDEPNAEAPPPLNHQHHIRRTRNKPAPSPPPPQPSPSPPSPTPPAPPLTGKSSMKWLSSSDDYDPKYRHHRALSFGRIRFRPRDGWDRYAGAINMLSASANFGAAVKMKDSLGLPTFWGDACWPAATNCSGTGGPVEGPHGCLKNGGCWCGLPTRLPRDAEGSRWCAWCCRKMAPDWEATVEAQAAELKPLIANKTVVGLCVRISPTNEANCP